MYFSSSFLSQYFSHTSPQDHLSRALVLVPRKYFWYYFSWGISVFYHYNTCAFLHKHTMQTALYSHSRSRNNLLWTVLDKEWGRSQLHYLRRLLNHYSTCAILNKHTIHAALYSHPRSRNNFLWAVLDRGRWVSHRGNIPVLRRRCTTKVIQHSLPRSHSSYSIRDMSYVKTHCL